MFGLFKKKPAETALRRPTPGPAVGDRRPDPARGPEPVPPAGATAEAATVTPAGRSGSPSIATDELGEILAPIVAAEDTQTRSRETLQRQLAAASAELVRLFPHLRAAPSEWHSLNAPEVLQAIIDAAADLSAQVSELWPMPPLGVRPPETGLDESVPAAGERQDTSKLESKLDGILFELQAMRETLIDRGLLTDLAAESDQEVRRDVGVEVVRLHGGLTTLLQLCIDALSQVPPAPGPEEELAGQHVHAAPAVDAPTPTDTQASAAEPEPMRSDPMPVSPPTPPARAQTDLGPAPSPGPPPRGPEVPQAADCEQALRSLQSFFNDNSPDRTLLKAREEEFAQMVGRLVMLSFPAGGLAPSEQAHRVNQLRHTLALRKKLKNNLTLTEFKALFAKRK